VKNSTQKICSTNYLPCKPIKMVCFKS